MSSPALEHNTYTHMPRPHPNLIVGSFQVIAWLLFHPSAWRHYVARIDPALRPDFTLTDLTHAHWQHPLLRRLFLGYSVYITFLTVMSLLLLPLFGLSGQILLAGLLGTLTLSITLSILGGIAYSVAVALALSAVGCFFHIIGYGAAGGMGFPSAFTPRMAIAYGAVFGLAGGLASHVAGNVASSRAVASVTVWTRWLRWLSGIVTGMLVGGSALFVIYSMLLSAIGPTQRAAGQPAAGMVPAAAGVLGLLMLVFVIAVGWKRTAVIFAVNLSAFLAAVLLFMILNRLGLMMLGANTAFSIILAALVCLPYIIVERIMGSRAGITAGTLGLGGGWIAWMLTANQRPIWPDFLFGFGSILAGLTSPWWGALLAYPLLEIWNFLLLRIDERRPDTRRSLLRWHAAFWKETQRLPFFSLEEHLLLAAERNPAEGQAAIAYLSTGHQRLAAQAAQIELDARRLERCDSVEAIRDVRHTLATGELAGPVSALLRSLSRIAESVEAALNNSAAYRQRLALSVVEERLDTLLREMTLSSDPYTVRFRSIAAHWRDVIAGRVHELAHLTEVNHEIDNPYIFSVPLTEEQELFVGRTDIAARIEQLILDRRRPPLLLYGQRRMGKTSLLRNLGRLLPSTTVPLFVDGEGVSGASDYADFLYAIALAMVKSAEQYRNLVLPPADRRALASSPFTSFNEWLDRVEQALDAAGSVALLALDEVEALDNIMNKGRFDETDILRLFRHLIQHRPRFKILLAGSHTLEELRRWASFLINLQVVKISYLDQQEALELIEHPVEGFALQYEPAASRRILEWTRGHPHLIQLLCYEIVELKNSQLPAQRLLATLADVEAVVPRALVTGDFFFADLSNQVGPAGLAVLQALASQGPGAVLDRAALEQHCPADLDAALSILLRRDVIEPVEGGYRFQVELTRRWFAQTSAAIAAVRG